MATALSFALTHCKQIQHHTWQHPIRYLPPVLTLPNTDHRITCSLHTIINNRRQLVMSASSNSLELGSTTEFELSTETDFNKIVSPDGLVSICGFGSLLSENSARSTFPDLINFRVARLRGFRRVFAHAAPIFFQRGIANPQTKEISSLSVEPCDGESLLVTVFEIHDSEIPSYIEREHEFRFLAVIPEALDGKPYASSAAAKRSTSNDMDNIISTRFGGMISYLVVFIFDTVCWLQKTLGMQYMITFWIIHSLETVKQQFGSI